MTRDLTRYAVVIVSTGEVLEVGMNAIAANAFVATYNRMMEDEDRKAQRLEIEWTIPALVGA